MRSMLGMDVFLQVAREGNFSAAAKALGLTPSGVSRIIARLEAHLGVRLLQRTTRAVTLTEEGAAFLQRSERILEELRDAEEAIRGVRQAARGRVRVDAAMVLAELTVGPALPRFLRANPEIRVELSIRNEPVDPVRERIDLVLRMAGTAPPAAISKRLGGFRLVTAASPAYLAEHGTPSSPEELHRHTCLSFLLDGRPIPWTFAGPQGPVSLELKGRLDAASGFVLRRAALDGVGIVHLYEPFLAADIASGALVPILEAFETVRVPVFAIYPDRRLPARARVLLEFLRAELGG